MNLVSNSLRIYCDGGARGNPGPAAAAFVVFHQDHLVTEQGMFLGNTTNNQAEYQAVVHALEWLVAHLNNLSSRPSAIDAYLDSNLVVQQLSGKFKIKNPRLSQLATHIFQLIQKHHLSVTFHYLPREQNQHADLLVNQTLDQALA